MHTLKENDIIVFTAITNSTYLECHTTYKIFRIYDDVMLFWNTITSQTCWEYIKDLTKFEFKIL